MSSHSGADIASVLEQNSRLCDQLLRERARRMVAEGCKQRLIEENEDLWRQVRDLKLMLAPK